MRKAHAKAPGKLYIAGEYAVVEPGYPAVIIAVDRFITVHVTPVDRPYGTIQSPVLSSAPFKWERKNGRIVSTEPAPKADILFAAMTISEDYLHSNLADIPYYDVKITSSMVSDDGLKYGLGSSGAVTVALIEALLNAFSVKQDNWLLYKLSALAHLSLKSHGSFGDLAAASFTGWIAYSSFDKEAVLNQLKTQSIRQVVVSDWPKLSIEPLPPLKDLSLLVGWTGSPASTESLVKHVSDSHKKMAYGQFLSESRQCVDRLVSALKEENTFAILTEITVNRHLLLKMSRSKHFELETPLLSELCRISETYQASAKSSGAGGGDCGIALVSNTSDVDAIIAAWEAAGITALPLNVYTH